MNIRLQSFINNQLIGYLKKIFFIKLENIILVCLPVAFQAAIR